MDALGGYSIFDGESCEYLVIRHDGVFVDPSGSVVYQDATAAIEARRAVPTVDTPHSPHPASLAHMANHSGSGEEINAVAWPWGVLLPEVDEDEDVDMAVEFFAKLHREDEEITARWPNWYHHVAITGVGDDGQGPAPHRLTLSPYGMALCAVVEIAEGDEILFDYGYATNGSPAPLPGWWESSSVGKNPPAATINAPVAPSALL